MWHEIAWHYGQPVPHVKRMLSSYDFIRLCHWLKLKQQRELEQACKPTPDHYYLARLTAAVLAVRTGKLQPYEEFLIPFEPKGETTQQVLTDEEKRRRLLLADNIAKQKMFAITGVPDNFEGWHELEEPEHDDKCDPT